MRRRASTFVPGKHKPLRQGPPRVVEDCELYHIVAGFRQAFIDGKDDGVSVREMEGHIQSWCNPWQDWQLEIMCGRARLFLGCIRKEMGRRNNLNPNQLRLLRGV